jgi:spore coat polysaccharide biosynthesis protein SpsF
MSKVGAIIPCRMDSQRLPGKALTKVGGRPLVDFVLARCRRIQGVAGNIVIATTDRPVDDPLVEFARANGVEFYRGDAEDVASRAVECNRRFGFDYFVRANGDSPFLEPALIDEAIELVRKDSLDFVTNLLPRSFPYGVSVEVLKADTYADAYKRMNRPGEFITRYLYEHKDDFRYANLSCPLGDQSTVRMTVDTPEDLAWFGRLVERFGRGMDEISYVDVLRFLNSGVEVS